MISRSKTFDNQDKYINKDIKSLTAEEENESSQLAEDDQKINELYDNIIENHQKTPIQV